MLIKVLKIVQQIEEEILFDVEAPHHCYFVEYKDNKLILSEIDSYYSNGDDYGDIQIINNTTVIEKIECTLKEFTNFVIRFYDKKFEYKKYEHPHSTILDKIQILVIK